MHSPKISRTLCICIPLLCASLAGADWPAWRYDAQRTAYRVAGLPETLHLQWIRELPEAKQAWPMQRTVLEHEDYTFEFTDDEDKVQFDVSYSPVAASGRLFVPSNLVDALLCYDLESGEELWRFHADGPVRFSPVIHEGAAYFVSDDGYLYCVSTGGGALQWRFRGAPRERLILGNERLISSWPARGAPVIVEDTVYFAAGIWPFMGIFIYAVDARTGEEVWCNSSSGAIYDLHQHGGAYSFGGVAPQGHLAVNGEHLLVAGGLTVPAVYDRYTGEFLYYRQASNMVGKGAGGYAVSTLGKWFFNHDVMYSLDDGAQFGPLPASVLTGDALVGMTRNTLVAHDPDPEVKEVEITDRLERQAIREVYSMSRTWVANLPEEYETLFFKAGPLYYVGGPGGAVAAVQVSGDEGNASLVWETRVSGAVWDMIPAGEKLIVVTTSGRVYCYGALEAPSREHSFEPKSLPASSEPIRARARRIFEDAGMDMGYCQVWGLGASELLYSLLEECGMHVMAFDADEKKVEAVRSILADADLYGRRASVYPGTPADLDLPPYLAEVIVVGDTVAAGMDKGIDFVEHLFQRLRPYGGAAYLPLAEVDHQRFGQWVDQAQLKNAQLYRLGDLTVLKREGALPGAGQWTHEHATSANTVKSTDDLAKAPLGILWFGGPTNEDVLPRHGYGPVPQVCHGRLFILGVNALNARDVYSGRQLWQVDFPGIGEPYQTLPDTPGSYLPHQPGAAFLGSCYVSAPDGVYVAYQDAIVHLDPSTGEEIASFVLADMPLPLSQEELAASGWSYIALHGNLLVAGAGPQFFDDAPVGGRDNWNATSSQYLTILNRYTGQLLWHRRAEHGFRHNAIATENNRIFVIDGLSPGVRELLERRGIVLENGATLYAFNADSGDILWQHNKDVFGTWLGYSREQDILIQSGRGQRGGGHGLPDEPNDRVVALRGTDGGLLWEYAGNYHGPLAIHSERIIPPSPSRGVSGESLNLRTGEPWTRRHPVTGNDISWRFNRTYGCGTGISSKHLLTFRSGAAGFYDLKNDGGTGNFGGFRASCTNNLVPADGLLNAPDYTRTCQCAYQNRASLAMIHLPEVEIWTYSAIPASREPVQRIGLNLGAPGDRLDGETLWLDYPSVGGNSPDIPVTFSGESATWFHMHSSRMAHDGEGAGWIGSSGVKGAGLFEITLASGDEAVPRNYTVTLHFAEPDNRRADEERLFHVSLQDTRVLESFDPLAAAGAARKTIARTFPDIEASGVLHIALEAGPQTSLPPVLSGIEIVLEP